MYRTSILVTDGEDMTVMDADATDGKARFVIPDGCYQIYARPLGKPNGCMEIDTLTCYECVDGTIAGPTDDCDHPQDITLQVDCDADLGNDVWVLQGFLEVERSKGKSHWTNATDELLGASGILVKSDDYFSFLWQVYNDNLRILQLRILEEACVE
jgi:hypothetical protein